MRLIRFGSSACCFLLFLFSAVVHAQTNLSIGATATGSSNLQPASFAIDGNNSSRWESNHGVDPSWITVDLGSAKNLASVEIMWEAANAANYLIQGSNNNIDWTTLKIFSGGVFGARTDTHSISGSYRYVRMHGTFRSAGNDWGYSIYEFKIFGSSAAQATNVVTIAPVAGGGATFSIRLPERKNTVHLFTRRNGAQDYVVTDVQGVAGAEINNGDGTYTYRITRPSGYSTGNLVDARFYSFTPATGQLFHPGPGETNWTTISYNQGTGTSSSTPASSSSSSVPPSSSSSSSSSSVGTPTGTNITSLGGAITTQFSGSPAGEGIGNLIDNNVNTKFLTFNASAWVRYQAPAAYRVTSYSLTSANDAPERDPLSWTLQGSNNGSTWTTIDSRSNQDFASRFQTRTFSFSNTASYSYYRFNFSNNSGSMLQLAELALFGTPGTVTSSSSSSASSVALGNIVPLYNSSTALEPAIKVQQGNQLITRISDRARDRHAKENQFQAYEHYLSFYWEHRTASIEIIETQFPDDTASIRMNVKTQWKLNDTEAENRWFYRGVGTVAEFCDNGTMEVVNNLNYYKERTFNCRTNQSIRKGDKLEFELSQFLDPSVPNGRAAYYGTTFLYIVGEGLVPWTVGGATPAGGVKDSVKIPESAWLGGGTTVHADVSNEPDNAYLQMATNIGYNNAQPFMLGRRVLHSSFVNGVHDENPIDNPVFQDLVGKAGPRYVNESCASCHERNGRAVPEAPGQLLDKWVFRVADANGNAHPNLGRVLQPKAVGGAPSEGAPSIAFWSESNGLRSPNYQFSGPTPDRFSARIAPPMIGVGLLEAIPESAILANENPSGSGISGRANRVIDPMTGQTRLGRFGWKAGTSSVKHQVVAALNTDMGVMTTAMPNPDCGSSQTGCGASGSELSNTHVDNLVKYVSLLGVRPQRNYNDTAVQNGKTLFSTIGCAGCHTPTWQTSAFHPLAELRNQTIHPYTDLLLHDLGPEMADNLGEGQASGSEWRTTPLWGLGSSACVTGGMTNAGQGAQVCTPAHGYLHDGRARTIEEAILWHGGEGQAARANYQALSGTQKQNVLRFLESL